MIGVQRNGENSVSSLVISQSHQSCDRTDQSERCGVVAILGRAREDFFHPVPVAPPALTVPTMRPLVVSRDLTLF
uniref:Uncharacterized protein n=1 Tax=Timema cristinae TaxID=61476 RepID=A0A7R9D7M1_TIMCR|nr:unnamed protein product [Timema cristinae]